MPLYDYRCVACDRQFEVLVRPGAEHVVCPACGGAEVERLLSLFAVSSEATRQSNLKVARARQNKTQLDKTIADNEAAARHRHDHH